MNDFPIQIFALRFGLAPAFGALVGLERQWRNRMAGMRTTALVAAGACAFVMSGFLLEEPGRKSSIVSYVVSGVGFLGAGVIFKENLQVRGLNTAATIWCSAAMGVITALGYPLYAAIVALGVILTNIVLRPLGYRLHPPLKDAKTDEVFYHLECTCRTQDESRLRALLLQIVGHMPLSLYALRSEDTARGVLIDADLRLLGRNDDLLEQIVTRLSLEESVTAISWQLLASPGAHPHVFAYGEEDLEPEDTE